MDTAHGGRARGPAALAHRLSHVSLVCQLVRVLNVRVDGAFVRMHAHI
jgi:hypothetical protein